MRLIFTFIITAALTYISPSASIAQEQPVPPEYYTLDPRGVDLVAGTFVYGATEVVIGSPDAGGIVYGRTFTGEGWRDILIGGINAAGTDMTVSVGAISEQFQYNGSSWVSKTGNGSTITFGAGWLEVTDANGNVARFEDQLGTNPYSATSGLVAWTSSPNGSRTDYAYALGERCAVPGHGGSCSVTEITQRLSSVRNNQGYMVKYTYASNDPQSSEWWRVSNVRGINLASDWCEPVSNSCSGFSEIWPSVTYGDFINGQPTTATDQSGRTTTYGYNFNGPIVAYLSSVKLPESTSNDISITYEIPDYVVSQVTDASGTWAYNFEVSGSVQTTSVEGPLDQNIVVTSDLSIGRATSVTNALNQTTSYQYDGNLRITRITQPEGNYVQYAYDNRSNLTSTTFLPKPGAVISSITLTSSYAADCTTPVVVPATICNKPLTTTAANGGVTNYEWDTGTGQLLSITSPAPSVGDDRPQTRFSYEAAEAWFHNGSTTYAGGGEISLPVEIASCVIGEASDSPACGGAGNEIVSTIEYPEAPTPNNLLPRMSRAGSRQSPAMSETTLTWTPVGAPASVDGPLSGSNDTTTYVYSPSDPTQLIGVIGPDPDGAGSGLNRARRIDHNGRGLVQSVEAGTAASGAWENFTPLVKVETLYDVDAFFRPKQFRQLSAGGAIAAIQQISYDDAGRPQCVAVRMNPTEFASLPASACTPGVVGGFGADRITRSTFDALGRVLGTTSAFGTTDERTQLVSYTGNGRVGSLTDGNGNISAFEYDGFDRLAKRRYPNASGGGTSSTDYEQYVYDSVGRPYSVRNRAGGITYVGYDALDRLIAVNPPVGTMATSSAYDNLGRLIATGGNGITVARVYDALSRLTNETTTGLGSMSYGYDAAGRMTRITWPDSFYAAYDYDLYGDVIAVRENGATSGAGVLGIYNWTSLGLIAAASRADGGGVSTTYEYDAWGRLSNLGHDASGGANDVTFAFGYNPAGQIVTRNVSNDAYVYTPGFTASNYTVNGRNQLTAVGSSSLGHDSNGNITSASCESYGYDAANRLVSVGTTAFVFDPIGRVGQSRVGSNTARYQYAGVQLVAEYDGAGALVRRYVPSVGIDNLAAIYTGPGTSSKEWPFVDERSSMIGLAGSSAIVSTANRYNEFGVQAVSNAGPLRYAGQAMFANSVITNNRNRGYAPDLGRFMQTDPASYAAGQNLYTYVSGDPMNWTDPFGLQDDPCVPSPDQICAGEVVVTGRRVRQDNMRTVNCDVFCQILVFVRLRSDPREISAPTAAEPGQCDAIQLNVFNTGNPNDPAGRNSVTADNPFPGTFHVLGHGRPEGMVDRNGDPISSSVLADTIRQSPTYTPGQTVTLSSCRLGGGSTPTDLANDLNACVIYADGESFAWIPAEGRTYVGTATGPAGARVFEERRNWRTVCPQSH